MKRDIKVSARVTKELSRKIEECKSVDPPQGFTRRKPESTADVFELAVDFLYDHLFGLFQNK